MLSRIKTRTVIFMLINNQEAFYSHLRELLNSLYDADSYDYAYDWDQYPVIADELVTALSSNLDRAVAFINSLDFNSERDAHLLNFFPQIMDRLKTFGEQFIFMQCFQNIKENHPNLNLEGLSFNMLSNMSTRLNDSL